MCLYVRACFLFFCFFKCTCARVSVFVCVCVCVRACVRACVRVYACERSRAKSAGGRLQLNTHAR